MLKNTKQIYYNGWLDNLNSIDANNFNYCYLPALNRMKASKQFTIISFALLWMNLMKSFLAKTFVNL